MPARVNRYGLPRRIVSMNLAWLALSASLSSISFVSGGRVTGCEFATGAPAPPGAAAVGIPVCNMGVDMPGLEVNTRSWPSHSSGSISRMSVSSARSRISPVAVSSRPSAFLSAKEPVVRGRRSVPSFVLPSESRPPESPELPAPPIASRIACCWSGGRFWKTSTCSAVGTWAWTGCAIWPIAIAANMPNRTRPTRR